MKNYKIANYQIKSGISFTKKSYEAKNIPFEREIQSFESFITEIAYTVNENKGSISDAIEMAEQSFKSL